jgi:uncharacterized protein YqjF (DUF2071 family)
MWWRDVAFLSWRCDADVLAAHLPKGIEPDLYAGSAWLSVVPFRITDVRVAGVPIPMGFGNVPEINLRAYVRVRGEPGVYFYSLDAASALLVRSARATTGLPYFDARVRVREQRGTFSYASDRASVRDLPGGTFEATYAPQGTAAPAVAGSLAEFLCERYRFFLKKRDGLYVGEVRHEPWQLELLDVRIARNTLGAPLRLDLRHAEDARFGRAVRVRASSVRRVG